MRTAALHNLGCKVNAYETDAMGELLKEAGYTIVPFEEKADVYIVNTCSVTNMADRKSRQVLHKARKNNPHSVIVACGCYVETARRNQAEDKPDPAIDIVIGNDAKHRIVETLEAWFAGSPLDLQEPDINQVKEYENLEISTTMEHTRAFIKIQDGCNQFCSYCIIPYARGRVRSRSVENILAEVERLSKAGFREVVLTGIHASSYGVDNGSTLLELIQKVHETEGIERIRLGSLEPRVITPAFVGELKKLNKFCPHFHLSLQSGCDRTLKAMNRKYTTEEFRASCELIRSTWPDAALTTDVITGFPQETEEDFDATCTFVESISFFETHIFKYSRRKGTVADRMTGQIPEPVKTERSARLLALNKEKRHAYMERFMGRTLEILTEEMQEKDGMTYLTGHTKEYVPCAIPVSVTEKKQLQTGSLVSARATDWLGEEMLICIIS